MLYIRNLTKYLEEIQAFLIDVFGMGRKIICSPGGESSFVFTQAWDSRPILLSGGCKNSIITNKCDKFNLAKKKKVRAEKFVFNNATYRKILKSWSISESPWNRGRLEAISAKIQPIDHTSIGQE